MATITTTVTVPTGSTKPFIVQGEITNGLEAACIARCKVMKDMAPRDAILGWLEERYGTWIKKNLSANYTITMIEDRKYEIAFTNPLEGIFYKTNIGGY